MPSPKIDFRSTHDLKVLDPARDEDRDANTNDPASVVISPSPEAIPPCPPVVLALCDSSKPGTMRQREALRCQVPGIGWPPGSLLGDPGEWKSVFSALAICWTAHANLQHLLATMPISAAR